MGTPERPQLTPTQWRVLEHLATGASNAEIAVAVGASYNTVATHLKKIYKRLPCTTSGNRRTAAASWYLTMGRALREREGR